MRNLELLDLHASDVGNLFNQAEHFTQITDNNYQSILSNYLYFIKNGNLYEYSMDNIDGGDGDDDDDVDVELNPIIDQQFVDVIAMRILPIECHIHVVTKQHLFILDRTRFDSCSIQHKIQFNNDIITANWSPIDDILITATLDGNLTVIPLNGIYQCDYQYTSHVDDEIPDTVYVGWGSENTQFRGSDGKRGKADNTSNTNKLNEIVDKLPRISWRGNGELFAINYYKNQQRFITIFDKNGQAQYHTSNNDNNSNNYPGLQSILSWRPNGNMLATIVDIGNEQQWDCVVFEKNGQKRFSFEFDCDQGDGVIEMKWSQCSRILAILTENPVKQQKTIHLFTTSNYKWYKKQKLIFKTTSELVNFEFLQSPTTTTTIILLRVITKTAIILYKFHEIIHRNNNAICCVINDNLIQITDFQQSIIPPPLCLTTITTNNSVNLLKLCDDSQKIAIINCENLLQIYEITNQQLLIEYDLNCYNNNNNNNMPLNVYNVEWLDGGDRLVFLVKSGKLTKLLCYNNTRNNLEILHESNDKIANFTTLQHHHDNNVYVIQVIPPNLGVLKPDLDLVEICNGFLLTCTNNLEYCGRKIADNVNSFVLTTNYLLFTTKLNRLHCIHLSNIDAANVADYNRNIEQGARIVCCIPHTSLIVLQLPRGNLETISCRPIAIDILDDLLENGGWLQALQLIKTEKLNVNLLYDLKPVRFCANIAHFVESFQQTYELTRLCLEFDNNNCLSTIYKNYNKNTTIAENSNNNNNNKTQLIFRELFNYFDTIDYIDYLSPIVVVNYHFFTLKDAIVYLQDAHRQFVANNNDGGIGQKLRDAVQNLRHYGCDDLKLFNTTLSLYDLDLCKFIINCLQIDPRYYQQQIAKFVGLPAIEQRYQINCYLKQPQIALIYLLHMNVSNVEDEVIGFIKNNNLYRQAYKIVNNNSQYYQTICRLYADSLALNRAHHLAGIVLKRAKLYGDALKHFRLALDWCNVLELCEITGLDPQIRQQMIADLCGDLIANRQYKDAAYLYENHLNQPKLAVNILITHTLWYDALFLIKKYHFNDLLINDFIPNLLQHKQLIRDKLMELLDNYTNYYQRLLDVRVRNLQKYHDRGGGDDLNDFDDLYSDVSSVTTRSNRSRTSSTRSSKHRRKDERKRQDLRAGGVYEDIALIRALFNLIQEIYGKQNDVNDCCLLLLQECGSRVDVDEIDDFYQLYVKTYRIVQNSLNSIWPSYFYKKSDQPTDKEVADVKNFEFLDVQYRVPPQNPGELKIDVFK